MASTGDSLLRWTQTLRANAREVIAESRNYRHAAMLRRLMREKGLPAPVTRLVDNPLPPRRSAPESESPVSDGPSPSGRPALHRLDLTSRRSAENEVYGLVPFLCLTVNTVTTHPAISSRSDGSSGVTANS